MAVPHCSEKGHLVIPPKKDIAEKRSEVSNCQVHLQHMQAICIQLLGMYLHLTVRIRENKAEDESHYGEHAWKDNSGKPNISLLHLSSCCLPVSTIDFHSVIFSLLARISYTQ